MRVDVMPGAFGAVVELDGRSLLDPSTIKSLVDALYEHGVVLVHHFAPTLAEYSQFGRLWGEPIAFFDRKSRNVDFPDLIEITNSPNTPEALRDGAMHWHQDSS